MSTFGNLDPSPWAGKGVLGPPRAGDRPKILVADETPSNIALLNLLLGAEHEIVSAASGEEVVELALSETPDLVVLDALIPGLDGFEACARLKGDSRTADIPVIFITKLEEETDEARALQLGAVDFISKPISPAAVRARVRNCLDLKRQRDLLGRLSYTDWLTGIANRRRLDAALDQEWRRAARAHRPLSLLLLDVDHFKRFNDAAGHLAGDDCLKRIAASLAGAVYRPGDLVARYGGEEFAAVLPDTEEEGALRVAERLMSSVRSEAIRHPDPHAGPLVTVSIGAATDRPEARESPASLVLAADRALYAAKEKGRDRVRVAPDPC